MRLVIGHDAAVASFVAMLIPQVQRGFGECAAIGVAHGDTLLGGVVYHDFQPECRAIQLSFGAVDSRWLIGPPGDRRAIVRGLLAYPFEQLRLNRVWGLTPKKNRRARAVIDGLGFKREGVARAGFGDDDAIISGLLRREWLAGPYAMPPVHMMAAA